MRPEVDVADPPAPPVDESREDEPSPATPEAAPAGLGPWVRRLAPVLGVYLASRAMVFAALALSARLVEGLSFKGALLRWDGAWYSRVIIGGYPPELAQEGDHVGENVHAFFPLFPATVRYTARLTGFQPDSVGLVLNVLFGATFVVALWLLVRALLDEEVAIRTVTLACFFPGSFVLSMLYSEGLMLTLAALCLLFLVRRRWLAAGIAAALATASRPNALALAAACGWAAGVAVRQRREWRALVAPALAPLGFLGFMAFLWARTDEPLVWFEVQRHGWEERFDWGAGTLEKLGNVFTDPSDVTLNIIQASIGAVVIVVGVGLLLHWRPPGAITVYALAIVVLALGSASLGGRPRFILTAFPLLVAVARLVRGTAFTCLVATSAVALGCLALLAGNSIAITP